MNGIIIIVRPVGGYGLWQAEAFMDAETIYAGGLSEEDALRRLQIKLETEKR